MMNKYLIQTGRSHRQMLNAIDLASKGIKVVYVERDDASVRYRSKHFERISEGSVPRALSVTSMAKIDVDQGGFDWDTMLPRALRDPRAGLVYIVDHTLAENEYQRVAANIMELQRMQHQLYPLTTGAPRHAIAEWAAPSQLQRFNEAKGYQP